MTNHYETLGIDRAAVPEQIKAAYKRLAQTIHPDKGGGDAAFQQLQEAYAVLSDPDRRARYDRGEDTGPINSPEHRARSGMAGLFKKAALAAEDHQDMIQMVRDGINQGIKKVHGDTAKLERSIGKLEKARDRVTYKGDGVDMFAGVIDQQIDNAKRTIESLDDEANMASLMLIMLNDYECEVTAAPMHNPFSSATTTSGWTTG